MKKIKRTITMRKVEFITEKNHDHPSNLEYCPFCHSPFSPQPSLKDSAIEIPASESQPNGVEVLENGKKFNE